MSTVEPGANAKVALCPSVSVAALPPMSNENSWGDPSGSVCFVTVTVEMAFVITQSVWVSG